MVAKPKGIIVHEKKLASVTPMVRGNLNGSGLIADSDTRRTIKEWCLEQGHSRGYSLSFVTMRDISYALWVVQQIAQAPNSPRAQRIMSAFQHRVSDVHTATNELLRGISYDEGRYQNYGEMELLEGDDAYKTGFYLAINPYVSPEKGVYSPVGENKTKHLTQLPKEEGKEETYP